MAVLRSKDEKELLVDCDCGCNNGFRIKIDKDDDMFAFFSYTNGNFYRDQNQKISRVIGKKLKRIWCILRNKDIYYSDICMTERDFNEFVEYVNDIRQTFSTQDETKKKNNTQCK